MRLAVEVQARADRVLERREEKLHVQDVVIVQHLKANGSEVVPRGRATLSVIAVPLAGCERVLVNVALQMDRREVGLGA